MPKHYIYKIIKPKKIWSSETEKVQELSGKSLLCLLLMIGTISWKLFYTNLHIFKRKLSFQLWNIYNNKRIKSKKENYCQEKLQRWLKLESGFSNIRPTISCFCLFQFRWEGCTCQGESSKTPFWSLKLISAIEWFSLYTLNFFCSAPFL